MISHDHKFAFIHIPRTGGTSIEKALGGNIKGIHRGPDRDKHGRPAQSKYPKVWNDDYFRFVFVRNPWDRVVSAFFYDKCLFECGGRAAKGPNRGRRKTISELGAEGFNDFVKNHLNKRKGRGILDRSVLYKRQAWWVKDFEYDFIGKFEKLQLDFDKVCEKLKMPQQKLGNFNAMDRTKYKDYYDDEAAEIVAELYKKDIELFNYKF
jgi:chondroitin 4-sulfotransferase 11